MAGTEIQIVHFGNANFPRFELKRKYWNILIMTLSIRGKALTLEHKISLYFVLLNIEHIKFEFFSVGMCPREVRCLELGFNEL